MGMLRRCRRLRWRLVPLLGCLFAIGCGKAALTRDPTPTEVGLHPTSYRDPNSSPCLTPEATLTGLKRLAESIRYSTEGHPLPPKRTTLVLSGGGSYGAFTAGVLVGWTQSGTRPEFDVITGVSTGAIIAALAFLGPDFDCELERVYTTLNNRDIFRIKKSLRAFIFSESIADTAPLGRSILQIVTPEFLRRIADEHAKGRRLYVGTTDLDSRRQVIWDMGAIASQGTVESRDLFTRVILASASIPGLFPPVRIPITVNGEKYEERHVDGGVTAALFFQPPTVYDQCGPVNLLGSDLYIIVAGKLFADSEEVPLRAPLILGNGISTLIYAQTRSNLNELYATAAVTGMNYRLSAVPSDYSSPLKATEFNPEEMTRMFELGEELILSGNAWRDEPPGLGEGEQTAVRTGNHLALQPGAMGPMPNRGHGPRLLFPAWAFRSISSPSLNGRRPLKLGGIGSGVLSR